MVCSLIVCMLATRAAAILRVFSKTVFCVKYVLEHVYIICVCLLTGGMGS